MANFKIKKGHNLKLMGQPSDEIKSLPLPEKILIHPNDFSGIKPKLLVKAGQSVNIGTALFYDKILVHSNLLLDYLIFYQFLTIYFFFL